MSESKFAQIASANGEIAVYLLKQLIRFIMNEGETRE